MLSRVLVSTIFILSFQFIYSQTNFKSISDKTSETGCISGNCQNGYGKFVYDDGDVYEGYFKEAKRHGWGKYEYIEGDVYDGQWDMGARQGLAYYKWPSGNEYIGYWYADKQNGLGTKYYTNGATEAGKWKDGVFQ